MNNEPTDKGDSPMNQIEVQQDTLPREGQEETSQEEAQTLPEPADRVDEGAEEVAEAAERMVPVSEAKRYRKRAQAAEATLEELKAQLAENQEQIRRSEALIESLERRQQTDELLIEHDAVDLESARLLVEQAIADGDADDVASAVAELQRRKPVLFHPRNPRNLRSGRAAASTAQAVRDMYGRTLRQESLERAASDASETGKRHDVMRYLRLRRRA
jgi:hypothetical protein